MLTKDPKIIQNSIQIPQIFNSIQDINKAISFIKDHTEYFITEKHDINTIMELVDNAISPLKDLNKFLSE